jgi:hypothetical protein
MKKAMNKNKVISALLNLGFFYQPFNCTYRKILRGIDCVEIVEIETDQKVLDEMQVALNQLKADMKRVGYKVE